MIPHLHFTFGPVQSFVAQARRTRDLYAGSLLLSHLAMKAMGAIDPGSIVRPDYKKLSEIAASSEHAAAPNVFVARFESKDAAAAAGHAAEKALLEAWRAIANEVWERYIEQHVHLGLGTREIWDRQVANFWNVAWIVADSADSYWLSQRKNWQRHFPPPEGGDHCVMMGQWQELSGFIRSKHADLQNRFWNAVRGGIKELDLEEGERLCAIAFIKRFFPAVAGKMIGRTLDPKSWPSIDPKSWPSTVTVAAIPWMRELKEKSETRPKLLEQAKSFAELAAPEQNALLKAAKRIKLLREFPSNAGKFPWLSGNFLNVTALANQDDTPLDDKPDKPKRERLLDELKQLNALVGAGASNFYSVLLMDGDSMGAIINQPKVTTALTEFAGKAPDIVAENDGVTVYAGGDDLLALLPLDRALQAALQARKLYLRSFRQHGLDGVQATISAAIVFAHYHCAFSRVLASAHELLDDIAKDRTGRNALAIRILKPGGIAAKWSAPFEHFIESDSHLFEPLIKAFRDQIISSSLLYNLRQRFSSLVDLDSPEDGESPAKVERMQKLFITMGKLFIAEALIGKQGISEDDRRRLESAIGGLVKVCQLVRRKSETKEIEPFGFSFDGPRLLKFLALNGKEGAE